VRVSQTLIRRARQTYLVCDASKFTRKAPVRIVSLRDIDRLFTDQPLAPALEELCAEWGTGVTVTT
jgi:DeoR family glycerol-3-phosphate regulon repressor